MALLVFVSGFGIGGLLAINFPANNVLIETQTVESRGLSVAPVQTEPIEREPLQVVPQQLEGPIEQISPSDWIKESEIEMRPDGVLVKVNNPQWAVLVDTNSMDPVFDIGSHLIQIIPQSQSQIKVGDIVSYAAPAGFTIVHRVIEIGNDNEGWYAILKGDNNPTPDPWKVRFDMVRRVTVMVVY